MDSAQADRSQTTAEPAQTAPTTAPPAAAGSGGFALDKFLDMPAAGAVGGSKAMVAADLGAMFKAALARQIDVAVPVEGAEMELAVTIRIPLGRFFITGTIDISASRDHEGKVTTTLKGALGPSVGDGKNFGDLMFGIQLQGEGASSARSVEMLMLALETYVRGVPNTIMLDMFERNPALKRSLGWLVRKATELGLTINGYIANLIWGKGHADAMVAAMQDGEAAQIDASGEIGFSANPDTGKDGPDLSVDGAAGVAGQHRIEKIAGCPASASQSVVLSIDGELSIGGGSGGFAFEVPLHPIGAGTLDVNASFKVDPKNFGDLMKYAAALTGAIAGIQEQLGKVEPEAQEAATAANGLLGQLKRGVGPAIQAGTTMLLDSIRDAPGLESAVGIDATLSCDFATKEATISFALVHEQGLEAPLGNGASLTRKLNIEKTLKIPMTPPR